jgi:biotin carboxylase
VNAEEAAPVPPTRRVLLIATTTGYQTRMFEDAAARLGVEIVYATDRCDHLDDPWRDGAIPVRFHEGPASAATVIEALSERPVDGVLAVGDRPAVLAAQVQRLCGLPGHPPAAAEIARDKRRLRERLRTAGLAVPEVTLVRQPDDPGSVAAHLPFPVVVKPITLSASRGVIRADDRAAFVAAVARIRRLLASVEVRTAHEDNDGLVQVERYIDGVEYAVEGLMEHGTFRALAVFDKPDPLVGPFFEETIYVTPSRAPAATRDAILDAVALGARAIGLHHGPLHAECRVADDGVYVLEIAARPIGGLCARALLFANAARQTIALEELLLRHALGESADAWSREPMASGVMMIPVPRGGVYRCVDGMERALAEPFVEDVVMTAKEGQTLVPLPEGASYLGFIFARAASPREVEAALRRAHGQLRFKVAPVLPVVPG